MKSFSISSQEMASKIRNELQSISNQDHTSIFKKETFLVEVVIVLVLVLNPTMLMCHMKNTCPCLPNLLPELLWLSSF